MTAPSQSLPVEPAKARMSFRPRGAMAFAARQFGMLLVLAGMTIPSAVVHAKLYKMQLVMGIVHQRYFAPTAS